MQYRILSRVKNRIRLKLDIPKNFYLPEDYIMKISDNFEFSYNPKTRSMLIKGLNDESSIMQILEKIEMLTYSKLCRMNLNRQNNILKRKRDVIIRSTLTYLISSLLPLPLRIVITIRGAFPFIRRASNSILRGKLDVNMLDGSAILGSLIIGDLKTSGLITLLLNISDYLEEWIRIKSRNVLFSSFRRDDENVWILINGRESLIKVRDLKVGDLFIVRTGSLIPADGIVIDGEAMVNQSSITGESMAIMKRKGNMVYSGTVVEDGILTIEAKKVGFETTVARIAKIIEESINRKSVSESYAESLANRLVPLTFALALLVFVFTWDIKRAISILVVDYSCAIKLFTPTAIMAGMINSARKGVLIKGGKYLELLSKTKIFAIDKTGTLTEASPEVVYVISLSQYSEKELLKIAACVEEHFPHPVATAILRKATEESIIHEEEHSDVKYIAAHGIVTTLNGKSIIVGSRHFVVEDSGVSDSSYTSLFNELSSKGYSVLYIAINGELSGLIVLSDPLREESKGFIKILKENNFRIILITGDAEKTANRIAKELGIHEYYSDALPEDKMNIVNRLKKEGTVVMIGDGINDAPALANAHVGISLSHGADIAQETADVLVLDGRLTSVIHTLRLSREVFKNIKRNFKFTVAINSMLILSGLFGFGSAGFSALLHNLSTILTALNSLRLLNYSERRLRDDNKFH